MPANSCLKFSVGSTGRKVAYSPNGKLLAVDGDDGIRLIDTKEGRILSTEPVQTWPPIRGVYFCDHGKHLLVMQPARLLARRTTNLSPVPVIESEHLKHDNPFATTVENDVIG